MAAVRPNLAPTSAKLAQHGRSRADRPEPTFGSLHLAVEWASCRSVVDLGRPVFNFGGRSEADFGSIVGFLHQAVHVCCQCSPKQGQGEAFACAGSLFGGFGRRCVTHDVGSPKIQVPAALDCPRGGLLLERLAARHRVVSSRGTSKQGSSRSGRSRRRLWATSLHDLRFQKIHHK